METRSQPNAIDWPDVSPATAWPAPPLWSFALAVFGCCVVVAAACTAGLPAAVAGLLASAGALLLFIHPRWVPAAIAALAPATAGLARGVPIPGLKLSEALIVLGAAYVLAIAPPPDRQRWGPVDWAAFAYAAGSAVIAFGHRAAGHPADLNSSLTPLLLFLLYRTLAVGLRSEVARAAVRLLLIASAVVAAITILQYLDLPGVRNGLRTLVRSGLLERGGTGGIRTTGPFPIWHSLGGFLIPPTLLAVALLLRKVRGVLPRPYLVAILAINVAAIVSSLTAAVIIGVVIGSVVVGVASRRTGTIILSGVLISVVMLMAFRAPLELRYAQQTSRSTSAVPQTLSYRTEVWRRDYQPLVESSAAFGVGTATPDTVAFRHTEMQYLTLLLRGGIPLLTLWALLIAAVLWRAASLGWRHGVDPFEAALGAAVLASTIAILPMQLVWPYFTNAGFPQVFFVLLGCLAAVGRRTQRSSLAQTSETER
jgi:hypothetical protein